MRLKRFSLTFLATLLSSVVCVAAASACTTTYTGPPGGNWGTAAYWSADAVPTSTDAVCISDADEVIFTPYASGGQQIYQDTVSSITVGAGATLAIDGESSSYGGDYYQESDLTANNSVTIDSGGTLLLNATGTNVAGGGVPNGATSGGKAQLYVANDPTSGTTPTLSNSGTIEAENTAATAFGEDIYGPIQNAGSMTDSSGTLALQDEHGVTSTNAGTLTVASGATTLLTGGPGFSNSGQVAADGTLDMYGNETWTQSGGSITGSTVSLGNPDTLVYDSGSGSFTFSGGDNNNALSGTIPAGQTVTVPARTTGGGNDIVLLDGTVTNNGTFTMDTVPGATGNPEVDPGSSGGSFVNNGTVNLLDPITSQDNLFRANLTNTSSGSVDVLSGTTNFDGGDQLLNQGTITIAPGASFVQRGGEVTNSATISPQIASATSFGMFDVYAGTFNAGGALSPVLVGGYTPAAGQEFEVMNIGATDTFAGAFASGGNGFSVDASTATNYPGNVGVIYGSAATTSPATTTPTTTPGPPATTKLPAATLHAGKATVKSGKLDLTLSCPAGHACGAYTVTATITEHIRNQKVIELTALAPSKTAKPKTTTKTVVIASAKGTVAGGKTVTLKLALSKSGAALLKRYGKLKAVVTVAVGKRKLSSTTVTLTEPKPVKKPVTKQQ